MASRHESYGDYRGNSEHRGASAFTSTRDQAQMMGQPLGNPAQLRFPCKNGHYEQHGQPRHGGMGVVFKALDKRLGRFVAIKRIREEQIGDGTRRLFQREGQTLGILTGIERVVTVYSIEEDEYGPFLVMEWIDGESLAELVAKNRKPLPWRDAFRYCMAACVPLHAVHKRRFLHLDIKPGNLMLDYHGNIWICDLGVARSLEMGTATASAGILGTGPFMAPEQEQNVGNATVRSEVWALGATAHYLASGRSMKGFRPSELKSEFQLSAMAIKLLEQATSWNPQERFSSMDELRMEFRAVLRDGIFSRMRSTLSLWWPGSGEVSPGSQPCHAGSGESVKSQTQPSPPEADCADAEGGDTCDHEAVRDAGTPYQSVPPDTLAPNFSLHDLQLIRKSWADYTGKPAELLNEYGIRLILIPPGRFYRGSKDGIGLPVERPRREIFITRPFLATVCPITRGQWQSVMKTTPWNSRNVSDRDTDPDIAVTGVSWWDAVKFCRELSTLCGQQYRLPTEAEWEYLCRAGTSSEWPCGNTEKGLGDYAWYNRVVQGPQPVGRKRPNNFGLFDMCGNVNEWCSDWFDRDWYNEGPVIDPTGPHHGQHRVYRGGSWASKSGPLRSAHRFGDQPKVCKDTIGFRMCCWI